MNLSAGLLSKFRIDHASTKAAIEVLNELVQWLRSPSSYRLRRVVLITQGHRGFGRLVVGTGMDA